MRNLMTVHAAGLFLAITMSAGCAADRPAEGTQAATGRTTLTGTVVDMSCYTMNEKDIGMDHVTQGGATPPNVGFACAYSCVKWQGMPAGLLTSDGKLYQIEGGLSENSNSKIAPHLTHKVTITGDVSELDGVLLIKADEVTMVSTT